jgi:type 1 glutamine amidotransferase
MTRRRWLLALLMLTSLGGPASAAPRKLLLVGCGPDGHPATTHEYMAGLKVLAKCLKDVPGLEVTVVKAIDPWREGPELMQRADGVVLFVSEGARWLQHDPKRLDALRQVAARKGGLVVLHWGMGTRDAKYIDDFVKLFGGCHGGPDRKYKVLETEAKVADASHPVVRGVAGKFRIKDEFYYRLKMVRAQTGLTPLLRVVIDGNDETVAWAWTRPDGGRSFGFSGLHFHANWDREEYRRLVAQGVVWTLGLPIPEKGLAVKVTEEDLKLDR